MSLNDRSSPPLNLTVAADNGWAYAGMHIDVCVAPLFTEDSEFHTSIFHEFSRKITPCG